MSPRFHVILRLQEPPGENDELGRRSLQPLIVELFDASLGRLWRPLSSNAKCNTPRRFDIGKVVQDLKECCHCDPIRICRRPKKTRSAFCGPRGGR
jgi:hypothetical protein